MFMKNSKLKRILVIIAIVIVLFAFLSIPASAYSTVIGVPSSIDPNSNPYYTSCPVPIEVNALYMTYDNGLTDYYQLAGNICPIVSFDDSSSHTTNDDTIHEGVSSIASFEYYSELNDRELDFYDSYDLNLIGTAHYYISGVRFYPNADLYDISIMQEFNIKLRDFYCWSYEIPNGRYSEIDIAFDYMSGEMPSNVRDVEFYYSLAGSSELEHVVIPVSVLDPNGYGYYSFTPSTFGFDDPNTLVYIYECTFNFAGAPTVPSSDLFVADVYYTFNPYLDNLAPEDSEGDNPALALIPYTTWLGEAVGGFMDFELYKGFTLGGIFVTLLSFTCVIWFLKLVAGG